jgi:hypothetical protein
MRASTARTIAVIVVSGLVLVACASDGDGNASAPTGGSTPATSDEAATTTATVVDPTADLTLVTLNMLHGFTFDQDCPAETEACQAEARLSILWGQIEAAGCPDVVTLQEVGTAQQQLVPAHLTELCDGRYELATEWIGLPAEVAILTTLPVLDHAGHRMSGINWMLQWVRVDSGLGPTEILTSHFASSSDPFSCADAEDYCADLCPEGATPGDCHPLEVLDFLLDPDDPATVQIVTGDLNRAIDDQRVTTLLDAGFVDVWTLAGNPECDPATGEGCTCCLSGDGPLVGLDQPVGTFVERIDFVLARAPGGCDLASDTPDDADGDGTSTGPFAREPVAEPVEGVYWSSDHSGVQADLSCR